MKNSLVTDDRLAALCALGGRAQLVPGEVAEVGVYRGGVLALLCELFPGRTVFGFDTFAGLPAAHHRPGEFHEPGEFAAKLEQVRRTLAGYPNVRLVPGIFPGSAAGFGDVRFSFVHLDVDFEDATRAALEWLYPRLSPGGIILVDDWGYDHCPGVARACEEFAPGRWTLTTESRPPQRSAWLARE